MSLREVDVARRTQRGLKWHVGGVLELPVPRNWTLGSWFLLPGAEGEAF
jgi:hypothetical protein